MIISSRRCPGKADPLEKKALPLYNIPWKKLQGGNPDALYYCSGRPEGQQ